MPPAALTCAADKKAGCCRAMNCAAMGFKPAGPPGGPKPLPKGFLSSLGSEMKNNGLACNSKIVILKMHAIYKELFLRHQHTYLRIHIHKEKLRCWFKINYRESAKSNWIFSCTYNDNCVDVRKELFSKIKTCHKLKIINLISCNCRKKNLFCPFH